MTEDEIRKAIEQVVDLGGMTVNERLFVSGLMQEFDDAKKADKEKARKILELLKVDSRSIEKIIN